MAGPGPGETEEGPRPGPRNALTDVEGLRVGNAQDPKVRTGVTVVIPDLPVVAAVDVRGGAPGTINSEALGPGGLIDTLQQHGVECIACDLLDRNALERLPNVGDGVKNIVFMAGHKFGAADNAALTWMMNVGVPMMVAETFREARI
ncbi:MAG: P1 family peptidase, partial [Geminicoccaceae bacterium]